MTKTESLNKMREKGAYDAKTLRTEAAEGMVTETEIIEREDAVPAFDPEKDYRDWPINSPVNDEGQVWLLLQPHNAADYEGRPATLRALWGLAHTKDPKKAKPYVAPYGTSGLYMTDECCLWIDWLVYVNNRVDNPYSPAESPESWDVWEG